LKKSVEMIKVWIGAARLRTLPLAIAVSATGNFFAAYSTHFQWNIVFLSILTTLLLQVLSNFANDLGDSIHGADHAEREGPKRAVQSGALSKAQMANAVKVFVVLSLVAGCTLIWISFHQSWEKVLPIFGIGLAAIAAAYLYTNGSKPYGYQALGDISVFVFFGLVAVMGTQYLHTGIWHLQALLPAISMGCWSTAVLNINNMRDIDSDQQAGKETIPIILGLKNAKNYHFMLVVTGMATWFAFGFVHSDMSFLGAIPGILIMIKTCFGISKSFTSVQLDTFLKPQALGTFFTIMGVLLLKTFLSAI
jgi:1,4-dihydroxy-2-naphthoate octaprenyltransferase